MLDAPRQPTAVGRQRIWNRERAAGHYGSRQQLRWSDVVVRWKLGLDVRRRHVRQQRRRLLRKFIRWLVGGLFGKFVRRFVRELFGKFVREFQPTRGSARYADRSEGAGSHRRKDHLISEAESGHFDGRASGPDADGIESGRAERRRWRFVGRRNVFKRFKRFQRRWRWRLHRVIAPMGHGNTGMP